MTEQTRRFLVECGERHCPNALVVLVATRDAALLAAHDKGWGGDAAAALRCPTHRQETQQ